MALSFNSKHSPSADWLRERPIAHRGLHDASNGILENSLTAAAAAMRRDYSIELDLQMSGDGVAMVFHDLTLERLVGPDVSIREIPAAELTRTKLAGSSDRIPTLAEFLDLVSGEVGVVIEMKGLDAEQDRGFVKAVLNDLKHYKGDYALMSFEHHLIEEIHALAPQVPVGLTAWGEDDKYPQHLSLVQKVEVDFISYYYKHLESRFVHEFGNTGRPIICWTVKNEEDAEYSAKFSDQPTFEGFLP